MNGIGKKIHKDGHIYFGELRNYRAYGRGILTEPDGRKFKGLFEDGKFIQYLDFDKSILD